MHAVTVHDGEIHWAERPDPVPGDRELLVAVRAAGLNGADMLQRRGLYAAPPDAPPDIPGLELAGEVVATGPGVTDFAVGDRVMAVVGGGGQAELACVHERTALRVPDRCSWAEAGGFAEVFTTAHDALFTQCGLTTGEHLVVHGAAGGVGIAGVQLGMLAGARVTATVRNPAHRDDVAALARAVGGPDAPITVLPHDAWADGGPYNVVLELVGGVNLADDVRSLAIGGRVAIIGVGGGARAELDLLGLMGRRGRIHGSTLRARPLEQKADAAQRVARHVLPAFASGRVRVPVAATYPMADAAAAYDHFAAGGKLGKIVLLPT
jgi:NADPH:quinone reductase-like Zn-dependent oxidoreductase